MSSRILSRALLPLACFAASAACAATLVGSGRSAVDDRPVSPFSGVALSIPAEVDIVRGTAEGVRITADDNVLAQIVSEVESGILRLRFRDRSNSIRSARIRATITAKTLESVAVSGSGNVSAAGLSTPSLAVRISGSGNVRVAGRAQALDARISGSGDLDAGRLEAQTANVSISGSGDALVRVRDTLRAKISGSGGVRFHGDPAVDKRIAGSGSVRRAGAAPL